MLPSPPPAIVVPQPSAYACPAPSGTQHVRWTIATTGGTGIVVTRTLTISGRPQAIETYSLRGTVATVSNGPARPPCLSTNRSYYNVQFRGKLVLDIHRHGLGMPGVSGEPMTLADVPYRSPATARAAVAALRCTLFGTSCSAVARSTPTPVPYDVATHHGTVVEEPPPPTHPPTTRPTPVATATATSPAPATAPPTPRPRPAPTVPPAVPFAPIPDDGATSVTILRERVQQYELEAKQNGPAFAVMRQVLQALPTDGSPEQQQLRSDLLELLDKAEEVQATVAALKQELAQGAPISAADSRAFSSSVQGVSHAQKVVIGSPIYRPAAQAVVVHGASSIPVVPPRPAPPRPRPATPPPAQRPVQVPAGPPPGYSPPQAATPVPAPEPAETCSPEQRQAYEQISAMMPQLEQTGNTAAIQSLQNSLQQLRALCGY